MSAMQMPGILGIHTGSGVVPCHEGGQPWGGWSPETIVLRRAVGMVYRAPVLRDSSTPATVTAWVDHQSNTSVMWGLSFTQSAARAATEGTIAYIVPEGVLTLPTRAPNPKDPDYEVHGYPSGKDNNGDFILGGTDYFLPFRANSKHTYWLPNGTVGTLTPEIYSTSGLYNSSTQRLIAYRYDANWGAMYSVGWSSKWKDIRGYAGPGALTGPEQLRGGVSGVNPKYAVKPGVRDGYFGIPGYPRSYMTGYQP